MFAYPWPRLSSASKGEVVAGLLLKLLFNIFIQLSQIERGELELNTFVAVKLAENVMIATRDTPNLYGADILVSEGILMSLITYENRQSGLNLTHSQDKDYIKVFNHFTLSKICNCNITNCFRIS